MNLAEQTGGHGPRADRKGVRDTRTVLVYVSLLVALFEIAAPNGGLLGLPISFILKNKFHFSPSEMASFMFWSGIPLYLAGLFGAIRDTWSPFKMGDRGYIVVFSAITAVFYCCFAFLEQSVTLILGELLIVTFAYLFIWSAWNGLSAAIGNEQDLPGPVSAARNVVSTITLVISLLSGGYLSNLLEGNDAMRSLRIVFIIGALCVALLGWLGLWQPRALYDQLKRSSASKPPRLLELRYLLTYKPVYPAIGIWFLWNLSPGMQTPLQYFLTDKIHLSDQQFGIFNSIYFTAYIPTLLLFGYLSTRYCFHRLLWWASSVGFLQMAPLWFVDTLPTAMLVAGLMGLMGGMATGAYTALLIRSCPKHLEGTVMMLSVSVLFVALRVGDLIGTGLYDAHGSLLSCIIATTLLNALIFPAISIVQSSRVIAPDRALEP